jgi:ankyrin repeat protein
MRGVLLVLASFSLISCGWLGPPVSPLAAAARAGDVSRIEELAAAGAPLDEPSGVNHWTPLMHAIHKNQPSSVEALLQAGADVNRESGRTTALIMAAGYGYADIVRTLLAHGANPRASVSGTTPLEAALRGSPDLDRYTVGQCQTATVRALLERDPSLAVSSLLLAAKPSVCPAVAALLRSR